MAPVIKDLDYADESEEEIREVKEEKKRQPGKPLPLVQNGEWIFLKKYE